VAAKIVRQPNRIALLGAPTSAAALSSGHEAAPAALRAAGLTEKLRSVGYEVLDLGDDPIQLSKPDEESPRARNISGVIAGLDALKPRVEHAVKLGTLPLILGGDCSIALAVVAGVRRYFRNVGLIYLDRDADLNTPATTPSGCLDGMVVAHLTGRGAAELVRFWGEPPLVREPDLVLFGVDRLDPAEEELLGRSTLRRYLAADVRRMGAATAAQVAVDRIHGGSAEFILHFDVDVIAGFEATNFPSSAGLSLDEVRAALEVFTRQAHLAAIEVTAYNPAKDPDGSGARLILDLLSEILNARLAALQGNVAALPPAAGSASGSNDFSTKVPPGIPVDAGLAAPPHEKIAAALSPGEAWSSESLEGESLDREPMLSHSGSPAAGEPVAANEGTIDTSDEPTS
jgi:arginase